jgi:uncharacterized protein YcbK (DUF882 family)
MKIIKDIQITENFRLSEFKCRHCDKILLPNLDLVYKLQFIRDIIKGTLNVSGYRCPEYNQQLIDSGIKASPTSNHMKGVAGDITSPVATPEELAYLATITGFTGIGLYDGHVHVDLREKNVFWDWRVKNKGTPFVVYY